MRTTLFAITLRGRCGRRRHLTYALRCSDRGLIIPEVSSALRLFGIQRRIIPQPAARGLLARVTRRSTVYTDLLNAPTIRGLTAAPLVVVALEQRGILQSLNSSSLVD